VSNPLDDAISKIDGSSARRQAEAAEHSRLARETRAELIQVIEDFLGRMDALGNPGMREVEKKHFRKITAWHVGWVWSDYQGGFWLKPDGTCLENGKWVPLKDKVFFGVDALGQPISLTDSWPGVQHSSIMSTHLEKAIEAMASIVRRNS
jgi:hypothetical protein